ncbi:RING-H2 finger protein ATL16 [Sesamum alatum]|uniref:RING-type E3 ubiquitin transferase n=1 Tax=Sesamum alatum TaxID=300844 RepID=A0AAE2CH36_9LAMI|nr:RING-H2 finger protein ATL16 [Sesamum alatum]
MDLVRQELYIHESESLSPIKNPPASLFGSHLHSSHTSFPIIAIAVIGILATGFLLVSYYIFVIKCCLNWHRIDLLGRFSFSRRRPVDDPSTVYSPAVENRGLDEAAIRSIPILEFKKTARPGKNESCECAVCLSEFQEEEKLRVIPNCGHGFHVDCVDVWLQNNANCPICRIGVSACTRPGAISLRPVGQVLSTSSSAQNLGPPADNFTDRDDEDYLVIEIGNEDRHTSPSSVRIIQERLNSDEILSISPSPRKSGQPKISRERAKRFSHVSSMGDEWINSRQKDEQFAVQPIRRSFSMDSAADGKLYSAVQEIIQQNRQVIYEDCPNEDCSSSRVKRSFFSFGHGRSSRSAVQPVSLDP